MSSRKDPAPIGRTAQSEPDPFPELFDCVLNQSNIRCFSGRDIRRLKQRRRYRATPPNFAEMLSFLGQQLARDSGRLTASLEEFVSDQSYGIQQLREDLDRFIFLLSGSADEQFLDSDYNQPGQRMPDDNDRPV